MGWWQMIFGHLTVQITSADASAVLNTLISNGLILHNVEYRDDLTFYATISRQERKRLFAITENLGAKIKILGVSGIVLRVISLHKRPVLLAFLLIVFLLACYLPSRILFVTVEGNTSVPDRYILEVAAECGIQFGAERRQVRSEIMKNKLLERIPQLQWAGINTSGCTATISVREKTMQEVQTQKNNQVSSIVASRDGIIQNCTVFRGNPLCAVGQAVKVGQTLVSGYLDCGIVIKTTQADAEIEALTFRKINVVAPSETAIRGERIEEQNHYSLRIGKKLIKFYKDSGNLHTTCGKIYLEEYVQLPGGFRLPIAIVKETEIHYSSHGENPVLYGADSWLPEFAQSYLQNCMISGQIIAEDTEIHASEDAYYLSGKYTCMEMIGQTRYEQTILKEDEYD